jgi:hypothetical protein
MDAARRLWAPPLAGFPVLLRPRVVVRATTVQGGDGSGGAVDWDAVEAAVRASLACARGLPGLTAGSYERWRR